MPYAYLHLPAEQPDPFLASGERLVVAPRAVVFTVPARATTFTVATRGVTFRKLGAMALTLVKQPGESRLYTFDFSSLDSSIASIANPAVAQANQHLAAGSIDLQIGSPSIAGALVQVRIQGGTDGELYKLTATGTDQAGNAVEMEGFLQVEDL